MNILSKDRVTLSVPKQFLEFCDVDGVSPIVILRGFMADLAGIQKGPSKSHGVEATKLAREYYCVVGFAENGDGVE